MRRLICTFALLPMVALALAGCGGSQDKLPPDDDPGGGGGGGGARYTVTELGRLSGCVKSLVCSINNNTQIVGCEETVGGLRAVMWEDGKLDEPILLGEGVARGISDPGKAVGDSDDHARMWADGHAVDLETLVGGSVSIAYDINEGGKVVGVSDIDTGANRAFLWDAQAGMRNLGTLGGGNSEAYGINKNGQVVGWSSLAGGRKHAFLWEAGTMRDITAAIPAADSTEAVCINDSGIVLINYNNHHPVIWQNGAMTSLGTLFPSLASVTAKAFDMNNNRQVVGTSSDRAFVWRSGVMEDLNELVPDGTPWLREARSINDDGQIVCRGGIGYSYRSFLLTPVH